MPEDRLRRKRLPGARSDVANTSQPKLHTAPAALEPQPITTTRSATDLPPLPSASPQPSDPAAPTDQPSAARARAPLDLRWHAPAVSGPFGAASASDSLARSRRQAIEDARSANPPLRPEERLARELGDDAPLRDESRGIGRRRVRKGTACVDVQDSRTAELNPFELTLRDNKVAQPCR